MPECSSKSCLRAWGRFEVRAFAEQPGFGERTVDAALQDNVQHFGYPISGARGSGSR